MTTLSKVIENERMQQILAEFTRLGGKLITILIKFLSE